MPIYVYQCTSCDSYVEEVSAVELRNQPRSCGECGEAMQRRYTPSAFSIEGKGFINYPYGSV